MTISAILLGAGQSKRMGVDKLSLPWGRGTLLEHCFETLLRSEVQELVVVLGIRNKGAKNLFRGRKVKVVINPYSYRGMSTSICRGLTALRSRSDGILIALGDQPLLKTTTIHALIHAFQKGKGGIIIPSFQGRRGHPVIFHRRYKKELLGLKGDVGGKFVLGRHPQQVQAIRVKSIGVVADVDTWQDYKKGQERRSKDREKG